MQGLHKAGAVDKATMRRFDAACLTPVEDLKPEDIKSIREQAHMSQAIFALTLNVGTSLVSQVGGARREAAERTIPQAPLACESKGCRGDFVTSHACVALWR